MGDLLLVEDDAWAAIEPQLPKNQPGARRVAERRARLTEVNGLVPIDVEMLPTHGGSLRLYFTRHSI